jgi:hypothetical protein
MIRMATTLMGTVTAAPARTWRAAERADRMAYVTAALLFASGVVHVVVLLATGRSWLGPLSLRKAATFGLSFGLTLASVTWATSWLGMRARRRAALLYPFTVACVVEVTLVTTQAWRGVPSHFNFTTPGNTAISMTLAAGGGVIIATALGFSASAVRATRELAPSLRLAIRYGLLIFLVALGDGAAMIARGTRAGRTDPELAYTTAGAYKPIHAVAMHAVLVIPALAVLLRATTWPERRRYAVVCVGIAGYSALLLVVAIETLRGISPVHAPPVGIAATVLAVLLLAGAGVAALAGVRRNRSTAGQANVT